MVQVIENRAEFDGRVLAIQDDATRPGHKRATFEVRAVRQVEAYPNLLKEAIGTSLDVVIPNDAAGAVQVGRVLRCRARRTGPATVFVESCLETGE